MPPVLALNDQVYRWSRDAKFIRKSSLTAPCSVIALQDSSYVVFVQYCRWVLGAGMICDPTFLSALLDFVRNVIKYSSAEKMHWITTWRVVTMMANASIGFIKTGTQVVRYAVGKVNALVLLVVSNIKSAIALLVSSPIPFPTTAGRADVYTAPETFDVSFFKWWYRSAFYQIHSSDIIAQRRVVLQ